MFLKKNNYKCIVEFSCGLGNQLFQYALLLRLKEKGFKVYATGLKNFSNNSLRKFGLGKYVKLKRVFMNKNNNILNNLSARLYDFPRGRLLWYYDQEFVDTTNFDCSKLSSPGIHAFYGYWQSKKFFPSKMEPIYNIIGSHQKSLDCNKDYASINNASNPVSIHVRRGDYLYIARSANIANEPYFNNSIKYINQHINNATFFVFSDDIEWCKENLNFEGRKAIFVEGNLDEPLIDLVLMTKCKHNIISNSTFSWWGQYLNENPDKIVIAPEHWYNFDLGIPVPETNDCVHIKNT